jgi:hypothetical protein
MRHLMATPLSIAQELLDVNGLKLCRDSATYECNRDGNSCSLQQ